MAQIIQAGDNSIQVVPNLDKCIAYICSQTPTARAAGSIIFVNHQYSKDLEVWASKAHCCAIKQNPNGWEIDQYTIRTDSLFIF